MSSNALMLEKKAAQFVENVTQKLQWERQLDLLRLFKSRSTQLEEALVSLAAISASYTSMRQAAVSCPSMDDIVKPIMEQAKEKQQKFIESPEWILDPTGVEIVPFMKKVTNTVDVIRQRLLKAWDDYLDLNIPKIQPETLATFRKIAAFQHDITTIEQNQNALTKLRGQMPWSSDIADAKKRCEDIRTIWSKFGQGNVPDEVLEFLRLAGSSTGAPMRLWTDTVKSWLTSQGIIGQCTIKI